MLRVNAVSSSAFKGPDKVVLTALYGPLLTFVTLANAAPQIPNC